MHHQQRDDVAFLEKVADYMQQHDLVGAHVTVQRPAGEPEFSVLRGVVLDEHGTVCAVLAVTEDTPFCYLLHTSNVQELDPVWNGSSS